MSMRARALGRRLRRSASVLLVLALALAVTPAFAVDAMMEVMKMLESYANAGQSRHVAMVLTSIAAMAPREFPEWQAIADKGAAAASRGDMAAAKQSCAACHGKYREAFRAKFRAGKPAAAPRPPTLEK